MRDKILQALSEADDFLSGQQLSEQLGVSRTAIWKAVGKLKEEGYEIEAVTNRGYRLVGEKEVDILNRQEIEKYLVTKWAGHPVYYEKETGSTNDDIMRLSDEGACEGTLCVASHQTAGKGRRGRTWVSPDAGNVYMSILLRPKVAPQTAPMTTLVMALAACESLQELYGSGDIRFGIKWPNDLVISSNGAPYKKFAGILTEMRMEDTEIRDVTVGIGLNLNMDDVEEAFRASATTLSRALGKKVNRAKIIAGSWNHFEKDYEAFLAAGDLTPLLTRYNDVLVNCERKVRILDPKGEYSGLAKGITAGGELIVIRDADKQICCIGTGEISVRGVMGYV